LSGANYLNANKGSSNNVHHYELVQAAHLVSNPAPLPSANDHPSFLPAANLPPQSNKDADAMPQQVSAFVVCMLLLHAVYCFLPLLALKVE